MARLTETQLNLAVQDLFGFSEEDWAPPTPSCTDCEPTFVPYATDPWPVSLPQPATHHDFDVMAGHDAPSALDVDRLQSMAAHFSTYAGKIDVLARCLDGQPEEQAVACLEQQLQGLAERAWRGPLSAAEALALNDAIAAGARISPQAAAESGLELLLQAPRFVYALADGPAEAVDPIHHSYGRAERLALFLWNSLPDDALLDAAKRGALLSAQGVATQVDRMMDDPRHTARLVDMHHQWLELDAIYGVSPDMALYQPRYWPSLQELYPTDAENAGLTNQSILEDVWVAQMVAWRRSMVLEAHQFVQATLTAPEEGRLSDLLTSPRSFGTRTQPENEPDEGPPTWRNYGVGDDALTDQAVWFEHVDDGMNYRFDLTVFPVALPPGERAGVLTLPARMMATSRSMDPSTVRRGVWVLDRLLCADVPPPPDDVSATLDLADHAMPDLTNRQRLETVTSGAACAGCHQSINAAGAPFERYDALGGHRTEDAAGRTLDTVSTLPIDGETLAVADAVDLAHQLSVRRDVHDCYARQWVRVGLGRRAEAAEEAVVDRIQQRFFEGEGRVRDLVRDVALHVVANIPEADVAHSEASP